MMTIHDPRARRRARAAARAGAGFSAAMLIATVWASVNSETTPAQAATDAGDTRILTPEGAQLDSGDGETAFTLALPVGAACTGDSANDSYHVHSYMVPTSVDPGSLTFASVGDGPEPVHFGEPYADFRQPLYTTELSPYTNAFTADAFPPGGPGPIINIPALSFAVFAGENIPSGDYNVGIACWGPVGASPAVDNFWNIEMTVVATTGPPPTVAWSVTQATVTTTALTVDPVGQADEGAVVTLTAAVTPADAAGTVTFSRGIDAIGTPVEVVAGVATLATPDLAAGSFDISAVFTPADTVLYAPSVSEVVPYVIGSTSQPTVTTTTLTVDPVGQADEGAAVTLTAMVTPAEADGMVAFSRGIDAIGAPVEVVAGVATLSVSDFAAGSFDLSATFTPTDPLLYASSDSVAVPYVIEASAATTTTTSTSTTTTTTSTSTTSTSTTSTSTTTTSTPTTTSSTTPPATTTTIGIGGPVTGPAGSGGLGTLPRTGSSMSMLAWAALLVVFGRISVLLGRREDVKPAP